MTDGDEPGEAASGLDLWQLAGMPGGLPQATYLTGAYAAQYRLIVDVLLHQQEFTLTGVAAADLPGLLRRRVSGLGIDPTILDDPSFVLEARMARLREWKVIHIFQDKAERDSDFIRNLDRYQLTEIAAALHRAVANLGQDSAAAAAATVAPSVLTAHLSVLRDAVRTDPVAAADAWAVIQTTHQSMAGAAASWQARLAEALAGAPNQAKISVVQETLRRYVDMWGAGVDTHSETITVLAGELDALADSVWRTLAVTHLGAAADDRAIEDLIGSYRRTLQTLRVWFDGPDCQARRLRRQMRDTIGPVVRSQRTLAAIGGHISRRAELLGLAAQLEAAADDDAAWSLWCTATGLFSARHLPGVAPMPAGNPGATSFWDAEPVPVEARLRKLGPKATTGGAGRMQDRSEGRRAARHRAEQQQAATRLTETGLLARSGLRLSEWIGLTGPELDLLMIMLGVVAAAPADHAGIRHAVTGDDRWRLRAEPALPGAASAVIAIADGRLILPDLRLHITASGSPR